MHFCVQNIAILCVEHNFFDLCKLFQACVLPTYGFSLLKLTSMHYSFKEHLLFCFDIIHFYLMKL